MKHKLLSILLCLAMALSLLPTAALAEEAGTPENYVTLELTYGSEVPEAVITAAKTVYEGIKYDTCKAANEAYMALYGVGTNSDGVLDVVNNEAPLHSYVNNTAPVTEVKFYIYGTLAGFTSLQSAGNQIDCTVGGNHQIARTSISIIGVNGSDGSMAKLTDGNVQAYVAGGYDSMYTDSGKLTIDNIEFTTTKSTTVGASAMNATGSSTKTATGEMEIKNCKFNGRLYVYDNFENTGMKYNIHDNVFDGANYSGDSNAYSIFAQCKGGNELIIKNNEISGFARGINIDHANIKATIEGNEISITDTGRACIQLSSLTTAEIKNNTLNLTGGNAITLHEKLLTMSAVPEVSITDNTITGTGYLIYDDAAANNKSFTSDKLTLTMGTGENANTIADAVDTTKGVKGSKTTDLTGYVAAAVDPAATINGVGYATLAEAISKAETNDTVTLLKDVTENVTIPADKTITLDLNGKVLSGGTVASTPALLNNGTVTIKDSSAEGTGMIRREDNNAAGYYVIDNQGTMTIESGSVYNATGTMPNGSSLIRNAGKNNEANLTINGGHIKQDGFIAIKNDDHGILEINGGLIETSGDTSTNTASAVQNWAQATINNGTINGTIWVGVWSNGLPNSVTTIKNAEVNGKIVVKPHSSDLTVVPKLNIEGGKFNVTGWDVSNSDNIDISGGSFSTDLKNTGYLADSVGAEVKSADGSTYGYYANVAAATAAAKPGDTVTDLKASTEQKVTLTLNYNDGATADTTYNVAGGTEITLPAPKRSGYTFNGWYASSTFYAAGASYTVSATATLTASWSYISSGGSSSDPTYAVSTPSKTEHGTVTVSPRYAERGDTVTITVKPDSGYVLETLTVTDKNGNELTLKDKGDGKYTFTMPSGKVEVKATFMEDNSILNFFYDVPNGAYFYEAVKWAVENGITTGVGNDLFAPEQPCTRAQIVTFLWRAAGSPEPKGTASGMTDVVSGSYYEKAVAWAIENGVTTGTTATTFSPDATCTRAQAVTFLARALNAKASSAAEFSDVPTDSYFAEAVAWAAANGVTEGIGGGLFGSDNDCTRGQIVTFLYRAYNK